MSSNIEITKVCECCGEIFTARRTTTRYCSHKCNSKAYKEGKRQIKMVGLNYSTMQEIERISDKGYLSVSETAFLLSAGRATIYRYLLAKCEGLHIEQSVLGRIFNFGAITVTTGGVTSSYPYIADPLAFRREINTQIG